MRAIIRDTFIPPLLLTASATASSLALAGVECGYLPMSRFTYICAIEIDVHYG